MFAMIVATLLGGPGFFDRDEVNFWRTGKGAHAEVRDVWSKSNAPEPVLRLLREPSEKNAAAYVSWQRRRMERLKAALEAVKRVSRSREGEILYFSRPDCPYCRLQERELKGLSVTRVEPGSSLWERYGVTVTPTLVVNGRILRGFTPRNVLLRELDQ